VRIRCRRIADGHGAVFSRPGRVTDGNGILPQRLGAVADANGGRTVGLDILSDCDRILSRCISGVYRSNNQIVRGWIRGNFNIAYRRCGNSIITRHQQLVGLPRQIGGIIRYGDVFDSCVIGR
jgi:hypothetical protein